MNHETHRADPGQQTRAFLSGEGDAWFDRNREKLAERKETLEVDVLERELAPFRLEVRSILEIGCGNGAKLRELCRRFNATGVGVDPSLKAVSDGQALAQGAGLERVAFRVGPASELPVEEERFDLVYFGFCLYLVDRQDLFRALAEADRVLRPGGFLAILDFDPSIRHKREYSHRPGLFSYKQSYSDLFTQSGHYYLVAKHSFSHFTNHFVKESDERVSLCVLYKEVDAY